MFRVVCEECGAENVQFYVTGSGIHIECKECGIIETIDT